MRRVKKGPGRRPQSGKRQRFMQLRARGWSVLAAAREVGVSRTSGANWARGYKTYRDGDVVGFVAPLDHLAVREVARYLSQDERFEIADLRRAGVSIPPSPPSSGERRRRSRASCAATPARTGTTARSRPTAAPSPAELAVTGAVWRPTPASTGSPASSPPRSPAPIGTPPARARQARRRLRPLHVEGAASRHGPQCRAHAHGHRGDRRGDHGGATLSRSRGRRRSAGRRMPMIEALPVADGRPSPGRPPAAG